MAIFKCNVCGYLYDEAGNTLFSALPNDWRCPICGAEKAKFTKVVSARHQVNMHVRRAAIFYRLPWKKRKLWHLSLKKSRKMHILSARNHKAERRVWP